MDFADELSVLAYVQESAQSSVNSQNRLDHIENRLRKISFQTDLLGLNLKISKFLELDESSHRIEMGADFAESDISTKYLQWETFKDTTKGSSFSDKNSMAPSGAELGIYLQDEIEIESLPEWVFTPSLRMDKYKVTPTIDKAFMDNQVERNSVSIRWITKMIGFFAWTLHHTEDGGGDQFVCHL